MASGPGRIRTLARRFAPGVALALGWALALSGRWHGYRAAFFWIQDAIYRVFAGFPALAIFADRLEWAVRNGLVATFAVTLFLGTMAVPLGFLSRLVARARLRAGHADPLARVRRLVEAHPKATTAVLAAGAGLFQAAWLRSESFLSHLEPSAYVAVAIALGGAQFALARGALRAWLTPVDHEAGEAEALDADEIHFAAVAVTQQTRAMVGGLAALSLVAIGWMLSLDIQRLYRDPALFSVMLAYMAVAAASAFAFQRASRISVGVDGVRVGGTSRTKFFAYRDLDEAREAGGDLLLLRRGRELLRLQLHGPDAARRAAILGRIRAGIARVAEVERDGAANLVSSARPEVVARALAGGGDYRMASVSRDGLWALVEGAAVDGAARTAAARAILAGGTAEERTRVRVAAGHCADPRVRVELEQLADEEVASEASAQTLGTPRSSRA